MRLLINLELYISWDNVKMTLSNKRIHELLEWVKSQKTTKRHLLNEEEVRKNREIQDYHSRQGHAIFIPDVDPIYGEPYEVKEPLYEILQHLLEVDIEKHDGRQYCKDHELDLVFTFIMEEIKTSNGLSKWVNKLVCPECFKKSQEDKE